MNLVPLQAITRNISVLNYRGGFRTEFCSFELEFGVTVLTSEFRSVGNFRWKYLGFSSILISSVFTLVLSKSDLALVK